MSEHDPFELPMGAEQLRSASADEWNRFLDSIPSPGDNPMFDMSIMTAKQFGNAAGLAGRAMGLSAVASCFQVGPWDELGALAETAFWMGREAVRTAKNSDDFWTPMQTCGNASGLWVSALTKSGAHTRAMDVANKSALWIEAQLRNNPHSTREASAGPKVRESVTQAVAGLSLTALDAAISAHAVGAAVEIRENVNIAYLSPIQRVNLRALDTLLQQLVGDGHHSDGD